MRAVVLVGGFGTRLRPLTLSTPKQMLPIVDRPMLEWVVAQLVVHGIDDVVLALGYRPDAFRAAYPEGRCAGATLHYAVEPEPLDTAGAIRFAAKAAGIGERFVAVNGDVLTDLDISALLEFHDARAGDGRGAAATISLHRVEDPSRFGVVATDGDGRVTAFVEKPPPGEAPSDLVNLGVYVFEPSVLERIPADRPVSIEREIFPLLVAEGALYGTDDGGAYFLDTGTPAQFLRAQLDLIGGCRAETPRAVHGDARVAVGATVVRSVVAAGAVVERDALVVGSAVLAEARVGAGARVLNTIVGPGAVVRPGAALEWTTFVRDADATGPDAAPGLAVPFPDGTYPLGA